MASRLEELRLAATEQPNRETADELVITTAPWYR